VQHGEERTLSGAVAAAQRGARPRRELQRDSRQDVGRCRPVPDGSVVELQDHVVRGAAQRWVGRRELEVQRAGRGGLVDLGRQAHRVLVQSLERVELEGLAVFAVEADAVELVGLLPRLLELPIVGAALASARLQPHLRRRLQRVLLLPRARIAQRVVARRRLASRRGRGAARAFSSRLRTRTTRTRPHPHESSPA
jgi:hypothetical protein